MPSVDLDAPEHAICSSALASRDMRIALLTAEVARLRRLEAHAYNTGVNEALDHVTTHIENLSTWSTDQESMRGNLLRWLGSSAGRATTSAPPTSEKP